MSLKSERIFLHIPKTGGTTLSCAIHRSKWMPKQDLFYYRHIQNDTKLSNAGDIFIKANRAKYKGYQIFTMLRHPVDRLISEYYFVRDRKEFFSLIKKQPKTLEQFINNPQSQNYMTNFLTGGRIYPNKPITQSHLDRVIETIEDLNIQVGIFEHFDRSLTFYNQKMGIKWPKTIDVKRVTLNRPKLNEISPQLKETIESKNALDMQLYNFGLDRLMTQNLKSKSYNIEKDGYGYVMKYTERFSLLQMFLKEKNIIQRNRKYFTDLNLALHEKIGFEQGRRYVNSFNRSLINYINKTDFGIDRIELKSDTEDPLKNTKELAEILDRHVRKLNKHIFKFDFEDIHIAEQSDKKSSFLGRLFGR